MIRTLLKPELIITGLEVPSLTKEEAIKMMSKICAEHSGMDEAVLCEGFMQREALDSTGFGNNVAIPHAKIKGSNKAFIGIFKFAEGVEWEALDDEPVKAAITLVMPGEASDDTHLKVISKFSRKLMDDDFVEVLVNEEDKDKLYQFLLTEMEG